MLNTLTSAALLALVFSPLGIPQVSSEKVLERAKNAWLDAAEAEEKKLITSLETLREKARLAGSLQRLDEIEAELERFLTEGDLPTVIPTQAYVSRNLTANLAIERAFSETKRALLLGQDVEGARRVADEQLAFRKGEMARSWKQVLDRELLVNGGAEDSTSLKGWSVEKGTWRAGKAHGEPDEGAAFFYPGPDAVAAMTQIMDLRRYQQLIDEGALEIEVQAAVRSYPQKPGDTTSVQVEYRDAKGKLLAEGYNSMFCSKDGWMRLSDAHLLPRGTRSVLVRLTSVRRGKGTKNNDGYFDGVSLKLRIAR